MKKRILSILLCLCLAATLLPAAALADGTETATSITVDQSSIATGAAYTGTLKDAAGLSLAGQTIDLYNGDQKLGTAITDVNGQFVFTITLTPGSYSIFLVYQGIEGTYAGAEYEGTLTVTTATSGTATKLTVDKNTVATGGNFIGTLTDAAGNPLAKQSVSVAIQSMAAVSVTTDGNGKFTQPVTLDPGSYSYTVSYAGDGSYEESKATGTLTVMIATSRTATKLTVITADEKSITGTLTDVSGNALSGKTVTIRLERLSNGLRKEYYITTGPDKADGEIRFSLDINLSYGTFSYSVLYAGDTTYAAAESVSGILTVDRVILRNSEDTIELMGNGLDANDTLITESIPAADCPLLLRLAGSDQVVGAYHIYLKSGNKGVGKSLYLTFRVPAEDAGKVFTLLHQKDDQTTETFRAVAGTDGTVTFGPISSLSPFLLTLPASETSPKTGDTSHPALWIGLLLLSGSALAVTVKKRRKSN